MPSMDFAIQLWECAADTNYLIIQRFQNKVHGEMTGAPWYVSNEQLHRDLNGDNVKTMASEYAKAHEKKLHRHPNTEAIQLL